MPQFDQATRFLGVDTPLGENKLILVTLQGQEELSRPFEYQLSLMSTDDGLDPSQLVGKEVTVRVDQDESQDRYFHGLVRHFQHVGWGEQASSYEMVIVPKLWTLTQTTDCRIFQEKTTQQIVEEILADHGITDYEMNLSASYDPWEYCVQYRESDFDFVSRMLEEEGIYYYFKHEQGKHTVVFGDAASAYGKCDDFEVEFSDPNHTTGNQDQVKNWRHGYSFQPGKFAQTDYNFKTPSTDLVSDESTRKPFNGAEALEVFDYHGRHPDKGRGKHFAKARAERFETQQDVARGGGTIRSFCAGHKFKFKRHRSESETGKEYVLTSVSTYASVGSYITGVDSEGIEFSNDFEAIPAPQTFRPARTTDQPVVEGPQTAVVVGPKGEEIYVDEHSRVKVQFHWDRYGKKDENSSCWVRVSQAHAGKNWGYIDIPRIGEEVIVDFLEGDPDAPIITGRVYNAEVMPPFPLDGGDNSKNKTRRGNTTKTYKGEGYNEMSMDDTKGEEQIRVHAQYNMDTVIEHDETHEVKNDRTREVGNDEKVEIGNDQTLKVGNDQKITIGKDQTLKVGKDQKIEIGKDQKFKVGKDQKVEIGMKRETKVGMEDKFQVGMKREKKIGMEEKITIGMQLGEQVGMTSKEEIGMIKKTQAGLVIELKCGASSIKLTPAMIQLKAPLIKIN